MIAQFPSAWLNGGDGEFRGLKLVHAAGGVSRRPRPLLMDPCLDGNQKFSWISAGHENSWRPLEDVGCYVFNNLTVAGRMHLGSGSEVFCMKDIMPHYWRKAVASGALDVPGKSTLPVRTIETPSIVACAIGYTVYGHWVLDILPRLWLFERMFGKICKSSRLIFPYDIPEFAYELLEWRFGISRSQIEPYNYLAEQLNLRVAYVPTLTHTDYAFHDTFKCFLDETINKAVAEVGQSSEARIYISRRMLPKTNFSTQRLFVNGAEIEDLVKSRGYYIVHPEKLGWPEQISLFSGCKICVGEFGSGLHNTWFSPANTVVVAFRWMNETQSAIAGMCDQRNIFVFPQEEDEKANFKMNAQHVSRAIEVAESYAKSISKL